MKNGVSCLCLTYGRPHLLEEAIESFHRQDYSGPKELIVLNDHPDQTLIYSHPEVVIVNLPKRIKTLGEKRNLSVALASYENLLIWDDDDIYLPWRITETMKTLPTAQFFKCPNAWHMNKNVIEKQPGYNLYHGGTAYTRWLFEKAGGYKMMNGGEDADIEARFQTVSDKKEEFWPKTFLPLNKLYYIYRWDHGSYHTTGCNDLKQISPNVSAGTYELKPHWNNDYVDLAEKAANVVKPIKPKKATLPIEFVCFSRNRPLQLDGYLQSLTHFNSELSVSVLYACDKKYQKSYEELVNFWPNVRFIKETKFAENLLSLFSDKPYICFGCDDVVFTRDIDVDQVLKRMSNPDQFAFSFRLGKNINRSMFSGSFNHPEWIDDGKTLTWDLHKSHEFGDFGYSWELDGTVYPSNVAKLVVEEIKPSSPNTLEAAGGGKWSSKTNKKLMSCFEHSALSVPSINVVQRDFKNGLPGDEITTDFLLLAWENGLRLDVKSYIDFTADCIHVSDLFLRNK